MTLGRRLFPLFVLVASVRTAGAQHSPPWLGETDLLIAGFSLSADTAQVRLRLGVPVRVIADTARNEDGELLTAWHYTDLVVSFDEHGKCWLVQLLTSRFATTRGIRLGSRRSEVERRYGPATMTDSTHATYGLGEEEMDTRGIGVIFTNSRVSALYLGNVISVE